MKFKTKKYLKKYGLVPSFKADIHLGAIMCHEVGDDKREIAYLSDATNTTAHIQNQA
ncbi:MAG: hypothetical protein AAF984_08505 [Verrucomicrobiota bacterium]